jgi:hypothetical protein
MVPANGCTISLKKSPSSAEQYRGSIHDDECPRGAALAAMHTPAVRGRLTELGAEIAKWAVPIKASGVNVA